MKTKLIAVTLFTLTTAAIAMSSAQQNIAAVAPPENPSQLAPPAQPTSQQQSRIEVVFALDTTGSMSGMISAAKEKIWSIASNMASAESAPQIKMGLVAYRDRGDAYVTRVIDLSDDLDSIYAQLMEFQAAGGGDGPESVNQALDDAINKISWSQEPSTYRAIFLVGDAPPHMDYQDDVKYPLSIATAKQRGIVVNTIQCGKDRRTQNNWNRIASLGGGNYFQVGQNGDALAITTPFDEQLAKLSAKLDETRLYYGDRQERAKQAKKVAATEKLHAAASVASRARRATFNASEGGKRNFLGNGELVDDVSNGRVDLDKIEPEKLPAPLQAMAPKEQRELIAQRASERSRIQAQIKNLTEERADYIKERVADSEASKDSLDYKIFSAIRAQASDKGLRYESDEITY